MDRILELHTEFAKYNRGAKILHVSYESCMVKDEIREVEETNWISFDRMIEYLKKENEILYGVDAFAKVREQITAYAMFWMGVLDAKMISRSRHDYYQLAHQIAEEYDLERLCYIILNDASDDNEIHHCVIEKLRNA